MEFLKDYLKFNVKDCWNSICKIYFEYYNIGREVAVLEEDVGTLDLDEDQKTKIMSLSGVKQYPMRVKCATLSWHTLVSAFDNEKEQVKIKN